MGIERMLLLLEAAGVAAPASAADVYAIVPDTAAMSAAVAICEALRALGVTVQMHGAGAETWGSMKSQFKRADASGARHALVFGADELARGEVAIKPLRDAAAAQRSLRLHAVADWGPSLRNA